MKITFRLPHRLRKTLLVTDRNESTKTLEDDLDSSTEYEKRKGKPMMKSRRV